MRLLLRGDGVLFEHWHPLDQEGEHIPLRWDGPHVALRFGQGLKTLITLPVGRIGPADIRNAWPKYRPEWEDLIAMLGDGVGEAFEQFRRERNQVRIRPTASEISRMETVIGWPGYVRHDVDRLRAFGLRALAFARDRDFGDLIERGKHQGVRSEREWRRLAREAADDIAVALVRDHVAVF
jgi:hypothetical protein